MSSNTTQPQCHRDCSVIDAAPMSRYMTDVMSCHTSILLSFVLIVSYSSL